MRPFRVEFRSGKRFGGVRGGTVLQFLAHPQSIRAVLLLDPDSNNKQAVYDVPIDELVYVGVTVWSSEGQLS